MLSFLPDEDFVESSGRAVLKHRRHSEHQISQLMNYQWLSLCTNSKLNSWYEKSELVLGGKKLRILLKFLLMGKVIFMEDV